MIAAVEELVGEVGKITGHQVAGGHEGRVIQPFARSVARRISNGNAAGSSEAPDSPLFISYPQLFQAQGQ